MKNYINVLALYTAEGDVYPKYIIWIDGRKYQIERILDRRRAASLKSGGFGMRYRVVVSGQIRNLFFEDIPEGQRWFIEED